MANYYIYIVASRSRTLYVGVTSSLARRIQQHREHAIPGFTSKYNISRLVYVERTDNIQAAIAREKQLKGWRRDRKLELIGGFNPAWEDLGERWLRSTDPSLRSG